MTAKEFYLGVMIVEDDPAIAPQQGFLLDNRDFRKQTPRRLYQICKRALLIQPSPHLDDMIAREEWPSKDDMRDILNINPRISEKFMMVKPDIAYTADEAIGIWNQVKHGYLIQSPERFGCYIAIVDHDMPGKTGLDLAREWRPLKGGRVSNPESPLILFYTGKAPLLEDALTTEGYLPNLDAISKTGVAEAVLHKGVSHQDFNQLIWNLLQMRINEIAEFMRH